MKKVLFAAGAALLFLIVWTNLNAPVSIINVISDPGGARVTIDEVDRGLTPLETSVPSGKHSIVITKEGHASYVSSFEARRGETINITVTLDRLQV